MKIININNGLREIARKQTFEDIQKSPSYELIISLAFCDVFKYYVYTNNFEELIEYNKIKTKEQLLKKDENFKLYMYDLFISITEFKDKELIYNTPTPDFVEKISKFNNLENQNIDYSNIIYNSYNFFYENLQLDASYALFNIIQPLADFIEFMQKEYEINIIEIFKNNEPYDYIYEEYDLDIETFNIDNFYFLYLATKDFFDHNGIFQPNTVKQNTKKIISKFIKNKYDEDIEQLFYENKINFEKYLKDYINLANASDIMTYLHNEDIQDTEELFLIKDDNEETQIQFLEQTNIDLIQLLEMGLDHENISTTFKNIIDINIDKLYFYLRKQYTANKNEFIENYKLVLHDFMAQEYSNFAFSSEEECERYGYDYMFDLIFKGVHGYKFVIYLEENFIFNDVDTYVKNFKKNKQK